MPKELTHWLLADRILAGLPPDSSIRSVISAHHNLYLIGAILPDTLLHLYRGPHSATALALSDSFHNTGGNSFAPLIRVEAGYPHGLPPAMLSCLLGVITHMEADIVFHPLVYALTGTAGMGRHYRVETDIDTCFMDSGTLSANTHLADLVDPRNRETAVDACAALFDPHGTLPRTAVKESLALHCRIQAMYDSLFWKLAAQFLATVRGGPYRDRQHLFYPLLPGNRGMFTAAGDMKWQHPDNGTSHHGSLNDLAAETVRRGIALFGEIEQAGGLAAALTARPGENLLTGLYGVQQKN